MAEQLCVTGCGRPTPDSAVLLCTTCSWGLTCDLGDMGALMARADTTLAKLARMTNPDDGSRGTETQLPLHAGMYEAKLKLETQLVGWVRVLAEAHGEENDLPDPDMVSISKWLMARTWRIVTHPAAYEIHDEITTSVEAVRRLVDRPVEREFVGVCNVTGCPGWLYAMPNAAAVRCLECGVEHDADTAWERTTKELEGRLMTASEIAGLATHHGIARRRAMKLIGSWAHPQRQRIRPSGHTPTGEPTYRFGTVLEMLKNTPKRSHAAG